MKYLIAGLGNVGSEYTNTRHNIGFDVVDFLAREKDLTFKSGGNGLSASFKFKGRTFLLLKPTTYMNLSGKAIRYWMQKEKIKPGNLLVVVDDKNLPFGTLRLRGKGSDGGHNGLKDINQQLGNQQYARLRFGIGSEFAKGRQVDFVLGEWTSEEGEQLSALIEKAADMVKSFGTIGLRHTMNQYNN